MDGLEMVTGRRSIRKYKDEVVSREKIMELMEAVRFTQSWGNSQTVRFNFVQDRAVIQKMMRDGVNGFVYNMKPLEQARNVMVLTFIHSNFGKESSDTRSKVDDWEVFDAGIACQTFTLVAHALGLGTCVMGVINDEKIGEIIDLPDSERVGAVVTFGYADETGAPPKRLEATEISRFL